MARRLMHSVDRLGTSTKNAKTYKEHGTSIKELIGREGMRVIGQAYDRGVVTNG